MSARFVASFGVPAIAYSACPLESDMRPTGRLQKIDRAADGEELDVASVLQQSVVDRDM